MTLIIRGELIFNFFLRLITGSGTLGLVLRNGCTSTSDFLALVLEFLDCLTGLLLLLNKSSLDESMFWLELSHGFLIVIDQAKAC